MDPGPDPHTCRRGRHHRITDPTQRPPPAMHHILAAGTDNTHGHTTPLTTAQYQSLQLTVQPAAANPDCGLKTRKPDEVNASLRNMVTAAREVRAS